MAGRLRRTALVVASGLLVGVVAARLGMRATQALAGPATRPSAAAIAAEYDASTVRITGQVAAPALSRLVESALPRGENVWVVVVVRGRDLAGCEDLGRQLRELQHRAAAGPSLRVWTPAADREAVQRFLRRERIQARVLTSASLAELGLTDSLVTPAVLRVRSADGSAAGVSHTRRFKNLRSRSFADELGL